MKTCVKCNEEFKPRTNKGKPRRVCYKCRPFRPAQPKRSRKQPVVPSREPQTLKEFQADPHCPHCGSYPDRHSSNFPFCNARHRLLFTQRVAAEQKRRNQKYNNNPIGSNQRQVAA